MSLNKNTSKSSDWTLVNYIFLYGVRSQHLKQKILIFFLGKYRLPLLTFSHGERPSQDYFWS